MTRQEKGGIPSSPEACCSQIHNFWNLLSFLFSTNAALLNHTWNKQTSRKDSSIEHRVRGYCMHKCFQAAPHTVIRKQRAHTERCILTKSQSRAVSEGERDQRWAGAETGGPVWADEELEGFSWCFCLRALFVILVSPRSFSQQTPFCSETTPTSGYCPVSEEIQNMASGLKCNCWCRSERVRAAQNPLEDRQ